MSDEYELPGNLAMLRDGASQGPSRHTLEKRQRAIQELEREQGEIWTMIDDLRRISDQVQQTSVVGKYAIPSVNRKLREMRRDLVEQADTNRKQLEFLRRTT